MSGLHGFCTSINPKLIRIYNPTTTNPFPNRTTTNLCLNHHHVISAVHLFSSSEALTLRRVSSMATATPSSSTDESKPFSVLFVCLGNICRSPAAEAVFRNLVEKRGLTSKFRIDSPVPLVTMRKILGDKADGRMRAASQRRGIEVTSISRPIRPSDFRDFDLILAMDLQNKEDIMSAYERWRFKEPLPDDARKKVKLMCSYCKKHSEKEVPDPYYGGPQGFEKVLDLLEDACESMLDSIVQSQNAPTSAST